MRPGELRFRKTLRALARGRAKSKIPRPLLIRLALLALALAAALLGIEGELLTELISLLVK